MDTPNWLPALPSADATLIDPAAVFPLAGLNCTVLQPAKATGLYLKRPSLLDYNEISSRSGIQELVGQEVAVCELLKLQPHVNIAEYKGVAVEGGRIIGLYFKKYAATLAECAKKHAVPTGRLAILDALHSALNHLHGLRYCHNDVNPTNVMFDDQGRPVLIDFDACRLVGDQLLKGCTLSYFDDEQGGGERKVARKDLDKRSLSDLAKWLEDNGVAE
eukprot:TRINITY_DN3259_c0_g1_i13.p1 TRINITY_DN3259_c0_g1~~TRINITY_DN3259_c0_g1_i13.p1  ORF type:complete len:218 (+),score=37.01 TRINITY_DN3259_c0_g1_i13:819-1472(+)